MANNDNPRRINEYDAPAQNRPFGEEARRETEHVFRRTDGESLDEYLRNINTYLTDLNTRLGVQPPEPALNEPVFGEAVPGESVSNEPIPNEPVPGEAYAGEAAPAVPQDVYMDAPAPEAEQPPYGGFDPDAFYAEAYPQEPTGSNWQAAVPNPELYPDLDDPQVTGRKRSRKKQKRKKPAAVPFETAPQQGPRAKKAAAPKTTAGGKSRFSFVTTLLNLFLYVGWTVLYFVCATVRSVMFTNAQAQMAAQGVTEYSMAISSPLFAALRIVIYAMPVVLLLWMKGVLSADKKGLQPVDRRLLIAAFAADLLAGVIVIFDVLAAKLIFA